MRFFLFRRFRRKGVFRACGRGGAVSASLAEGIFPPAGGVTFSPPKKSPKSRQNLRFWNPFPIVTIACRRPALYVDTPLLSLR